MIVPDLSRPEFEKKYPKIASAYAREHAHFLGWEEKIFRTLVSRLLEKISWLLLPISRLRHDPNKLSKVFKPLELKYVQLLGNPI